MERAMIFVAFGFILRTSSSKTGGARELYVPWIELCPSAEEKLTVFRKYVY